MSLSEGRKKLRSFLEAVAALGFFALATSLARHGAARAATEAWVPLFTQILRVALVTGGFWLLGRFLDKEEHPIEAIGLKRRKGWCAEVGLGLAFGWAIVVVCVLPLTVIGGISVVLLTAVHDWAWLLVEALFFLLLTLGEELVLRGYGFQRLIAAVGEFRGTVLMVALTAVAQWAVPSSTGASILVAMLVTVLLSVAYLRTRALWVSWSINFGWKASRAILFGLAVRGDASHSPVVEGNPMGPFWLTGGGYGLDASWWAAIVLLAALPILYKVTRELDFVHNAPVLIPGGIPMNLGSDPVAEANVEAPKPLVQILPMTATELPVVADLPTNAAPDSSAKQEEPPATV